MLAAASILLGACAGSTPEGAQGVEGQVLIGPMCPVMVEGQPCPDQPYQATLAILDTNGRELIRVETDTAGRFKVALEPGSYTMQPQPGEGIAFASPFDFSVQEGTFTQVMVLYDSGIR